MNEYKRYAVGVVLLIFVIVLLVIGFNLVRSIFNGGSDNEMQQAGQTVDLLGAGTSGQPVRYTVSGNIVGNEEYRSIRITVDAASRKVEVLQGYNSQVISTQETPNTQEAYEAFTAALNGGGFTSNVDPAGRGEEAQSCPLGRKFSYEVNPDADGFRSWSTSCSRRQGTFTGNNSLVQTLFQRQIPEYTSFVSDVRLSP